MILHIEDRMRTLVGVQSCSSDWCTATFRAAQKQVKDLKLERCMNITESCIKVRMLSKMHFWMSSSVSVCVSRCWSLTQRLCDVSYMSPTAALDQQIKPVLTLAEHHPSSCCHVCSYYRNKCNQFWWYLYICKIPRCRWWRAVFHRAQVTQRLIS